MSLTLQTHSRLTQCYYEYGRNFTARLRKFHTHNGLRNDPCSLTAYRKLIQKFKMTGFVEDRKKLRRSLIVKYNIVVAEGT